MIATPTLTGPELEQTIASKATVLAWFDGTPNCLGHAFPSFAPVMRRLALHLAGVAKVVLVDVDLVANDALSYGVYGAPELLLFMDADGQHDPADIPRLLEKLDEGYDMVVGARDAHSQASWGRGLANRLYNRIASYMTGQRVDDLTSGFRLVRARRFREFMHLLPNGFSYPTTSTMAFFRAGYPVGYLPIHAAARVGKSHIRPLHDGLRFLLIIFKVGTLYSPLKLFAPLAIAHFMLGAGYYLFTFLTQHRLSNMSVFMFTAAVTIFLIGLVSEQITQLLYQPRERDG